MREIFFIFKFIKINPIKLHADISFFLILCVQVFCMCVCLCTRCVPNLLSPERVSDPWSSSRGLGASQPGGFGHSALVHVSISNIYVLFAVGRFLNSLGMLFQNRANKGSRAIWGFSVFFPSLSFPVGSGRIHCIMEVLKLTVLIQLTKAI